MKRLVLLSLVMVVACGPEEDDERGCAKVMYDSLESPHPTRGYCFPSVGEDTAVGSRGLGQCQGNDRPAVVFTWSRFFASCPSCGPGFSPSDCRPLVCTTDDDCPHFNTKSLDGEITEYVFECRNSLCQDADTERSPVDVITNDQAQLLCLANVARVNDHYQGEPYCPGVDWLSNEPCPLPLPDACMQP